MADDTILVDTSVLIEFLRSKDKPNTLLWKLKEKFSCCASSITLFEIYCGATTVLHLNDLERLFRWIDIKAFDNNIAILASQIFKELKSKNKLIEYRDIFIAANAIHFGIPLATLNTKHFERISILKLFLLQ